MLTFTKFKSEDKKLFEDWLATDPEGMKFMGSYAKDDFAHLIDFLKRYLWVVSESEKQIGFFDFERESSEIGYPAFYVRPEFRGRGIGLIILKEAIDMPELKTVSLLEAGVEAENSASIKTLEKAGFKYAYTDEDGMLMYQLSLV
jgi:RimJ/RimL family protein N-acetyltransferase